MTKPTEIARWSSRVLASKRETAANLKFRLASSRNWNDRRLVWLYVCPQASISPTWRTQGSPRVCTIALYVGRSGASTRQKAAWRPSGKKKIRSAPRAESPARLCGHPVRAVQCHQRARTYVRTCVHTGIKDRPHIRRTALRCAPRQMQRKLWCISVNECGRVGGMQNELPARTMYTCTYRVYSRVDMRVRACAR